MAWVCAALLVAGLLLGLRLQRRYYFFQYAFLCRYPLLLALALVATPWLAVTRLGQYLGNLFEELRWFELALLVLIALLAARACWFMLELILVSGPARFGLPLRREGAADPGPLPHALTRAGTLGLAASWAVVGWLESAERGGAALGIAAGAAAAGAASLGYRALLPRVASAPGPGPTAAGARMESLARAAGPGYAARPGGHLYALAFFTGFGALYLLLGWLARPDAPLHLAIPTLGLLILLGVASALWITGAAFFLDLFRVPVSLVLIGWTFLAYSLFESDHFYPLEPHTAAAPATATSAAREPLDDAAVLRAWSAAHPAEQHPIPIVVASSGGGITAAYWTAVVLDAIRRDPAIGERFFESLVATSSVSGGSVGLLHVLDGFGAGGPPAPDQTAAAVERAGRSALEAVAWGWVFSDFLRSVLPPLADPLRDRGWALEQTWRAGLRDPDASLRRWREGVAAGWRPTSIFNATLVETGQRLVIQPHDVPPRSGADGIGPRGFLDLYAGADLGVATAARLSATFPWVTPVARPRCVSEEDCGVQPGQGYHVADGAYYDNDGVASALEFLEGALPALAAPRRAALLVRIRAAEIGEPRPARENAAWELAVAGPIRAMLAVRTSSQISRNAFELRQFQRAWRLRDVEVHDVLFALREPAPLSWYLSEQEKAAIRRGLEAEGPQRALQELRQLLR